MSKYYLLIFYVLFLFILPSVFSQDFNSQIINTGGFAADDPMRNHLYYPYNGYPGAPFVDLFYSGPCTFALVAPTHGPGFVYCGYKKNSHNHMYNTYAWSYSFDSNLIALTQNGRLIFINNQREISQVRWYERRYKSWKPDGSVFEESYIPRWTVDLGIYYPDEMCQLINGNFQANVSSRLTDNSWYFRLFDNPGIRDINFRYYIDGNYVDSGLYYANFANAYYDLNGEVAPVRNSAVKLLLRIDGTCFSGLNGNASWINGTINIDDWNNPPQGLILP